MFIYTLKKVSKLGEPTEFGQKFWCEVEEQQMPVTFTKKVADILEGSKIVAETAVTKPGKNGNFTALTKVTLSDGAGIPAEPPTPAATLPEFSVKPEGKLDYEAGTNARWALKIAIDTHKAAFGAIPETAEELDMLENFAFWLTEAFERVKAGTPKPKSGIEKAREAAKNLPRSNTTTDDGLVDTLPPITAYDDYDEEPPEEMI